MSRGTTATLLAAALLIASCTGQQYRWVPPAGVSGRQMNLDMATCRQVSAPINASETDVAIHAMVASRFIECMNRAGYSRHPVN